MSLYTQHAYPLSGCGPDGQPSTPSDALYPTVARLLGPTGTRSILGGELAGGLWAFVHLGAWEPLAFSIDRSFELLFMVVIGGVGSILGAFLGAAFITILPIFLNQLPGILGIPLSGIYLVLNPMADIIMGFQRALYAHLECSRVATPFPHQTVGVWLEDLHDVHGSAKECLHVARHRADATPGDRTVTIQAGPNNPVGVVWIDLSKPHYGIHGTPEPSKIGHVESHGCVRLTNWDATTVANWVKPGTRVVFRE